jgi:hypothetical protein
MKGRVMRADVMRSGLLLAIIGLMILCSDGYGAYQLVWSDEFDGTSLNTSNWSYQDGDGCPNLCGWGNNELQYYRSQNTTVSPVLQISKHNGIRRQFGHYGKRGNLRGEGLYIRKDHLAI